MLPLLVADMPIDAATAARVLQRANVSFVRVTWFGTKQRLPDTQALFRKWLGRGYMRATDTVEVDIGFLEYLTSPTEAASELEGSYQERSRQLVTAVAAVDQFGCPFPYSYNKKAVVRNLLSIESYPLFGSCFGTEFAQGSYTLNFRVRFLQFPRSRMCCICCASCL